MASLEAQLDQECRSAQALRSLVDEKEASAQEASDSFNNLNKKFLEQSEDLRLLLAQVQNLKTNRVCL